MDSEELDKKLKNVINGENTYLALKNQYKSDSMNLELLLKFAEKESNIGRAGDDPSQQLWYKVINLTSNDSYEHQYA